MPETITSQQIIERINGYVAEMDGETIADLFNSMSPVEKATYIEDSYFNIESGDNADILYVEGKEEDKNKY